MSQAAFNSALPLNNCPLCKFISSPAHALVDEIRNCTTSLGTGRRRIAILRGIQNSQNDWQCSCILKRNCRDQDNLNH
jgi:hypothetical protein